MSEETTTNETTTTTTEAPEKEITLDDVYRDAGLDKVETKPAQPVQQTQQVPQRIEPSSIPDPYDSENFKAYIARQAAGTTALQNQVAALANYLTTKQQADALESTKKDIDNAVSTINETVNHPKPKFVEAYLDGMVREDPKLKAIWDNRSKNPTAWKNALKVVSKQMAEELSVKVDPQLVTAQRARKDAQKQMQTTSKESADDQWGKMSDEDFSRNWERLVSGGN